MWSIRAAMFLWMCSCASTQPSAASTTAAATSSTKSDVSKRFALVGAEGLLVEAVDLRNGEALLRITGGDGPLQNKVISHRRAQEGQDLRYTTVWNGREWLTLLRSGSHGWLGAYWQLYVPGQEAASLSYSEDRSDKVDVDSLFAAHEAQRRAGELEQIQSFDRSAERGRENDAVATSATAASSECGSTLRAAIVWDTVSDQALREHIVSDYCASALRALKNACFSSPELKSFVQKQIKDVSCRYDGSGEMSLDGGHLTWSMSFELGDLDNLAGQALTRIYLPQQQGSAASHDSARGAI